MEVAQLRIVLIDRRQLIRSATADWLATLDEQSRIATFETVHDFIDASPANRHSADLIIVAISDDHQAQGRKAIEGAVRTLCDTRRGTPVVVISSRDEEGEAEWVLRLGARGYLPATLDLPAATTALRTVLAGGHSRRSQSHSPIKANQRLFL